MEICSTKEAELSKLICNSERDLYFALANEIAMYCDINDMSYQNVFNSCSKNYQRSHLKLPGPVGGPCLTKDPVILLKSTNNEDFNFELLGKSRVVNDSIIKHAIDMIDKHLEQDKIKKITIAGLTFKGLPENSDFRDSPAINLIKYIYEKYNCEIVLQDKFIEYFPKDPGANYIYEHNFEKSINQSNLLIIHNNHSNYKNIEAAILKKYLSRDHLVYDFWNQSDKKILSDGGIQYIALGEKI